MTIEKYYTVYAWGSQGIYKEAYKIHITQSRETYKKESKSSYIKMPQEVG